MSKQKDETGGTYYFVTLETRDRGVDFRDAAFRTQVELHWAAVMRRQPDLIGEEYAVNDHALHGLVRVTGPGDALEMLHAATQAFLDLTRADWTGVGDPWSASHKFRRIANEQELRSLRDFIMQKMLGGEELSGLEDEEDWGFDV
ncbi:MAG: hypothetical protein AAGN35_25995 [Bacteroidota bacterium]